MRNIAISTVILLLIFISYLICIFYAKDIATLVYGDLDKVSNIDKIGQFGDSAGAVNALFSGLAFAGVVITLIIQNFNSKKETEASNRIRFENIFFQMLSLHQEIVNELSFTEDVDENIKDDKGKLFMYRKVKEHISGRELFTYFYESKGFITEDENGRKIEVHGLKELFQTEKDNSIYEDLVIPTYFDHYFRHLYRIVKFVDTTPFLPKNDFETRYNYIGILRAQLSRNELIFLFYNGLSCYGNEKFKELIEKYSILKNIRLELLANEKDIDLSESKCTDDYIENKSNSPTEYKRSAFMKTKPIKRIIKITVPKVLDININIRYADTRKPEH